MILEQLHQRAIAGADQVAEAFDQGLGELLWRPWRPDWIPPGFGERPQLGQCLRVHWEAGLDPGKGGVQIKLYQFDTTFRYQFEAKKRWFLRPIISLFCVDRKGFRNEDSSMQETNINENAARDAEHLLGKSVIVRTSYGVVRGILEKLSTCADGRKGLALSRGTVDKWISPDDLLGVELDEDALRVRSKESVSDGNIVVAAKNNDTVEIWWHNTPGAINQLTVVSRTDARSLYALLGVVLGGTVTATEA